METNYYECKRCGHAVATMDSKHAATGECVVCRSYPANNLTKLTDWNNGTVELYRTKEGRFLVRYGEQLDQFRKDQDLRACEEFGACMRHALECAGVLDAV